MIEFIMNNFWQIACSVLAILTAIVFSFECYVRKEYNKLAKQNFILIDEKNKLLEELNDATDCAERIRYQNFLIFDVISNFINEHNSWHDRKIAFYYDKDGWHCLYADEIPQGDIVTEQEEINEPNEHNNENNKSV